MDIQKIGEKLKALRGQESRDSFSAHFGIHRNTLAAWESGERLPSLEFLSLLAQQKKLSVAEILGEAGVVSTKGLSSPQKVQQEADTTVNSEYKLERERACSQFSWKGNDFTLIPLVKAVLSAGGGSFETTDKIEGHYAFRNDFLYYRGNPKTMKLFRVDGDSMEPRVSDGDIALIDQGQVAPRAGKIYAVRLEDVIYLKVLNTQPGKLILSSYNTDYTPIEFDTRGDMADCFSIIGRAVWIGRELD
ncbi:XRE family transcriptional regulator [Lawsonia intracellularis]|uniref:Predicted transcriptional regulator n=1 Tax=Lawsonia intracellularis (strain PHE/MN1-00) TaxID=363253 RepID=Q1MQ37_LAWIP|nr:XRE family transcriptional regulator [Lawsonia intracellularis]AGC50261.1 peptidase S24-like family protein [Lawsonia intracellularis N343]KAA0204282.1 XRE family transcriptional regulator [Lawsonia intracellularis]MBZ3892702.1 XRE family transcriptional regulator [Lawsonia intracellularis]RBN33131.1 XRE family transcriptional regulator [Lawsonia intracellularis]RBN35044.1 XRE family transcriptional regulator [Lawsonia intracellularis]